jgi:hypothetical protein
MQTVQQSRARYKPLPRAYWPRMRIFSLRRIALNKGFAKTPHAEAPRRSALQKRQAPKQFALMDARAFDQHYISF